MATKLIDFKQKREEERLQQVSEARERQWRQGEDEVRKADSQLVTKQCQIEREQ